jgi:hypothetical protein
VKLIKTDFSVRCGVNAGFVYFDETTPLEADRVIDVAGHMQKYADPSRTPWRWRRISSSH